MDRDKLSRLVEPMAEEAARLEGCIVLELNLRHSARKSSVELTIDRPGGVGVEDCARVSRRLGRLFDESDPFENAYLIEISSPGLNRRLTQPREYDHFRGRQVLVSTLVDGAGVRELRGTLDGLNPTTSAVRILDETNEQTIEVPLHSISWARLEFAPPKKPKRAKR